MVLFTFVSYRTKMMRKYIDQLFYYYIKVKLFLLSKSKIQWKRTNLRLHRTVIRINKIKYHIGNYELGSGAFGKVYPARRSTDGINVAIKVVSLTDSTSITPCLIELFLNEVSQSMKLSKESKHVVQMFDFDCDRTGRAFIVMECGDYDLEKALIDKPTLPINKQRILWRQILNIFLTLHNHSLVHMDLKPSNLVFFGNRLKLVDLGIAQKANTQRIGPNGTYGFSAPEIHLVPHEASSPCTYKADVWSIGAILYWINYGDSPRYDHRKKNCSHPPIGIPPCKNRDIIDLFQHTIQMDYHRRPDPAWLIQHRFTCSLF